MKDIITILETAQRRYDGYELSFRDQTQTVLSILRAKDVLAQNPQSSVKRWHTLLAAALVVAYEDNTICMYRLAVQKIYIVLASQPD